MRHLVAIATLAALAPFRGALGQEAALRDVAPGADAAPAPAAPVAERWSVSVGTGAGGVAEFTDAHLGGRPPSSDVPSRTGRLQVNVRADRALGGRFRAGLAYTFQAFAHRYASAAGAPLGELRDTVHTLLADVTLRWRRGEWYETYSALAAGAGLWIERGQVGGVRYGGDAAGFAFQLRAFGVTVGSDRLRAFAELGLGFEGLLVAGIAIRL